MCSCTCVCQGEKPHVQRRMPRLLPCFSAEADAVVKAEELQLFGRPTRDRRPSYRPQKAFFFPFLPCISTQPRRLSKCPNKEEKEILI